ncbi:DUF6415 family natural product biosynthesis protein [Streptomyces sp. C10-9-1]|uniref:DUF6415 family natural product biosynthesis protein n=1 Tax=Streptomyces sp. C10-9-1 TaxID=1859285 RepID=UPI003F4A3310
MRDSARRLVNLGGPPPLAEDLDTLSETLRGHIRLLVPEIRAAIRTAPMGDTTAAIAQIGIDEAWRRLTTTPGFGPDASYRHARKLAMSVQSLCDHWENLTRPTELRPSV